MNPFETTPEALKELSERRRTVRKALDAFVAARKGDAFLSFESAQTLTRLAADYSKAYDTSIDAIITEVLDELTEAIRG